MSFRHILTEEEKTERTVAATNDFMHSMKLAEGQFRSDLGLLGWNATSIKELLNEAFEQFKMRINDQDI